MEKGVPQKRVYFLGAGASNASEIKELPTMREFFLKDDFPPKEEDKKYPKLQKFIESYFPEAANDISKLNMEEVITRLELSIDKFGAFGEHPETYLIDARREFNDYVCKRLTYPPKDGRYWCERHKVLVEHMTDQDSIITLNYDLIVDHTLFEISPKDEEGEFKGELRSEIAVKLEELPTEVQFSRNFKDEMRYDPFQKLLIYKGSRSEKEKGPYLKKSNDAAYKNAIESIFHGGDSYSYPCLLSRMYGLLGECLVATEVGKIPSLSRRETGVGHYLKLHGSIDWLYCENSACGNHQLFFPNMIGNDKWHNLPGDLCRLCGSPLVSVIIPPTMNKTFDEYPKLGLLWSLAYREIRDADELVLIGMSLPDSDYYLKWLINSAICSRDKKDEPLKVVAVNKFKYKIEEDCYKDKIEKLTGVSPEYWNDFRTYIKNIEEQQRSC